MKDLLEQQGENQTDCRVDDAQCFAIRSDQICRAVAYRRRQCFVRTVLLANGRCEAASEDLSPLSTDKWQLCLLFGQIRVCV